MTDKHLIEQLKSNKESGLQRCITKYTKYVAYIVENIIGNARSTEDKEELVADVFISLWNHRKELDPSYESLKPYLGQIARNKSKNALRNLSPNDNSVEFEDIILIKDSQDVEREFLKNELLSSIQNAVAQLDEEERRIFLGYYYYQKSIKVLASEMEMKESTIKVKLHRCREEIKVKLKRKGYDYYEYKDIF